MNPLEVYAAEFERCRPWIEAALPYSHGTYTIDAIRDAVMRGQMQLWPGERSALITEIAQYPARKGCIVAFAGGNIDELKTMAPRVMRWAKENGCDFASVQGRRGWVRALGIGRIVSTIAVEDLT